ncbi:hypothetical protein H6P81_017691 [Aristolochia fimbriata]|uniref:Uncharacterized protein n=1 Tax=Aristolochia fimbriata TaxID=158543 RepID=A0AAV7E365_ARIFI|nr:hypothetical protein H6P81_017691 [Aristolochia fimbriata]
MAKKYMAKRYMASTLAYGKKWHYGTMLMANYSKASVTGIITTLDWGYSFCDWGHKLPRLGSQAAAAGVASCRGWGRKLPRLGSHAAATLSSIAAGTASAEKPSESTK